MSTQAMPLTSTKRTTASVLSAELEMREWSLDYFAQQTNLEKATAEKLVAGREPVSKQHAAAFSQVLGGSTDFWLSLKRD